MQPFDHNKVIRGTFGKVWLDGERMTMTLHKYDSTIAAKYHTGVMNGELPDLTIVAAVDDPTGYGAERVALYDVKLDEITLSQFENRTVTEEEVPFTAGSFTFLDLIE